MRSGSFECSSAYPAISDDMNLKTMQHMSKSFDVPVGLSDHSLGSIGAVMLLLWSMIIENTSVFLAILKIDSSFSMEPDEFKQMWMISEQQAAMGNCQFECSELENGAYFPSFYFCCKRASKKVSIYEDNIK